MFQASPLHIQVLVSRPRCNQYYFLQLSLSYGKAYEHSSTYMRVELTEGVKLNTLVYWIQVRSGLDSGGTIPFPSLHTLTVHQCNVDADFGAPSHVHGPGFTQNFLENDVVVVTSPEIFLPFLQKWCLFYPYPFSSHTSVARVEGGTKENRSSSLPHICSSSNGSK